jgi:hypothetical protein
MSSYILDFVLHEADLSDDVQSLRGEVSIEFKADGLETPVQVNPVPVAQHVRWDFPARLILHLPDLGGAFMFASLYGFEIGGRKSVARARIPLKALPVGSPKRFKFPLMSVSNNAIMSAQVTLTASLSALVPYRNISAPDRRPRFIANAASGYETVHSYSSTPPSHSLQPRLLASMPW